LPFEHVAQLLQFDRRITSSALSNFGFERNFGNMAGRTVLIRQPNSPGGFPMTRSLTTLKNTILIAAFAILPLAAVNASAQSEAHVNVPFAFMANHRVVPAGKYKVLSSDSTLTLIDDNSGKLQAILLVRHEAGEAIETQGRLRFQVSGIHYVLIEAQFAGSSIHSELLARPKQERIVARRPEPTIQVAMK
jgi:hypothetical protein